MKYFGEVLLESIWKAGVNVIFGVPGGANIPLYNIAKKYGKFQLINTSHEEGAAFMADGYARVRHGLGVCLVTSGPGATNAATGVACAYSDGIPMLIISAQVPTNRFGTFAFQESTKYHIDVVELFKPMTKMSIMLEDCLKGTQIVKRLIETAIYPKKGPVHLSLPSNLIYQEVQVDDDISIKKGRFESNYTKDKLRKVAELLSNAKYPTILAGYGVVCSEAFKELKYLAELLDARVATTPKAKGAFPENHSLSLGVFGFPGNDEALDYLLSDNVDVLLVIGSRLGEWSSYFWHPNLKPSDALIRLDVEQSVLNCNYPAAESILSDAKQALSDIIDEIYKISKRSGEKKSNPKKEKSILKGRKSLNSSPIKPLSVIEVLKRLLPNNTNLFVDIGNCTSWVVRHLELKRPDSLFINLGWGAMGYSTAAAIGGKLANPDAPVVSVVGDGAFAMNGMELHTAAEYGINVIWIVFNDSGYGMLDQVEKLMYTNSVSNSYFSTIIDIASVARGLGIPSYTVSTSIEFERAFKKALSTRSPCVIDTRIDRDEIPAMLYRRARYLKGSY